MSSSVHSFTDASKIARGIAAYPSMEALDSAKWLDVQDWTPAAPLRRHREQKPHRVGRWKSVHCGKRFPGS